MPCNSLASLCGAFPRWSFLLYSFMVSSVFRQGLVRASALWSSKRVKIHAARVTYARRVKVHTAREKTLDSPALPFLDIRRSLGLPLLNARISVCDHITARKIRARTYLERCVGFTDLGALHTCALRSSHMHE